MSDKTKELNSSNGETKKSAGKFCFSLNAKTTSQPKSEPETTKNTQPKTDTASLLASLEAKQAASKKSDEDSNSGSSDPLKNIKPLKLKLTSAPKLAGVKRPAQEAKKISLADIFNPDEPPEEEEMPPEAKMRMRNIGKDTPTASGPNSFNKGKLGFCNQAKMFEKQLKLTFEEPDRSKRKLY